MSIIYGVDTKKPYSAVDVRNAIIECFVKAHKKELDELFLTEKNKLTKSEIKNFKKINIKELIKKFYSEIKNADFDNPTKESLLKLIDKLAEFASNFRDKEIIEKNYFLIKKLIDGLKQ